MPLSESEELELLQLQKQKAMSARSNPLTAAWNQVKQINASPAYSTSPMALLNKIPGLASKVAGAGGEFAATQITQQGADPRFAAGVGTAISMGPDIAMLAGPEEAKVPEMAVPSARRALGFSKRFLKTDWARQTANEAGRTALANDVIPRLGSPEVAFERAQELERKGAEGMNDVFGRAYQWVEGKNPFKRRAPAGSGGGVVDVPSDAAQLEAKQPALPLKTPQPSAGTAMSQPRALGAPGPARGVPGEDISNATVFEKQHRFVDKRKMIRSINELRPRGRGGDWDADHRLIDNAINTVRGLGPSKLTLEEANTIKSRLQSGVPYGSPGHELSKKIANRIRNVVDNSLDEFADRVGDPELSVKFKAAKKIYGSAMRMQEGLNNKLSSDWGNMPVSLPSVAIGSAEILTGNPIKGVMTMGGAELLKRRWSAFAARQLYNLSKARRLLPASANALKKVANQEPQ